MKTLVTILCILAICASLSRANDSLNVRQVGFCNITERGSQLNLVGNYVYCAALGGGLRIIDFSNPALPIEVSSFRPQGVWSEAYDVAVQGDYAFVEDYYLGMRVVNVSNPASPFEVGSYQHYSDGRGIATAGNYVYIAADYLGLKIVDVSRPNTPTLVGSLSVSARSHHVTVSGNYVYLSLFDPYSLAIIDVSNPSNPVTVGSYVGTWTCTAVEGNYAYLADGLNGMRILEVSNPASPTVAGNYDPAWSVGRITVAGAFAYVGSDSGMRVLDISDFNTIHEVGYYFVPSMPHDNDIVVRDNYAYVACGATPGFGALRIFDCTEAVTTHCPPTPLPFIDNFDSPELDSCWTWIREDTSHWSLTERPGWMRIVTQEGYVHSGTSENILLRMRPIGNFRMVSKLTTLPLDNYNSADMVLYVDEINEVHIGRGFSGTQSIGIQGFTANNLVLNSHSVCADTSVFLRFDVVDSLVAGYWSSDSNSWVMLGQAVFPWVTSNDARVGVLAENGPTMTAPEITADFDYFRIDSLPGTTVCGDVSGVWDSTGSPYYVTCDVTVPAGQTLEIQPGVEVLFTGHYKFNVLGNLQAIGTEQDSIVFTRAFPTEESKWAGFQFLSAADTSSIRYCVLRYVSSPEWVGLSPVYSEDSAIRIANSRFSDNSVHWGGAINSSTASFIEIDGSVFSNNFAGWAGGAIHAGGGSRLEMRNSLVLSNTALWKAGGIMVDTYSSALVFKSLIAENTCAQSGGAFALHHYSSLEVISCTVTGNQDAVGAVRGVSTRGPNSSLVSVNSIWWDSPIIEEWAGTSFQFNYTNFQGGFPGTGNIDIDPQFVDASNGDFHLQAGSPCIDTGDPNSPLDPDSTRADMGAFYYHQEPPCPPTEIPFIDNFDSPELDSCWTWIREDTSHWSLTARPGWMRIVTQEGNVLCNVGNNTLLRTSPTEPYIIETHLEFDPQQSGFAGLMIRSGDKRLVFHRGLSGTQKLSFQVSLGTCSGLVRNDFIANSATNSFLRLVLVDSTVQALWSADSLQWSLVWTYTGAWLSESGLQFGVYAENGSPNMPGVPADFDYFRIDSLPGTTVCGDVSGVWDSAGSPYYVTCDVTVPAGQTLEIQPGVEVLFTGHYKFNVFGNLQAIGTEQDSIVFTRAFPTEESKWWGIRFYNSASDSSILDYCLIEHGLAITGPAEESQGGGILITSCSPTVTHSTIRDCRALNGGGMAVRFGNPTIRECRIEANSADQDAGGIACDVSNANIEQCLVSGNTAQWRAGGLYSGGASIDTVLNCTIANNTATISGGGVYSGTVRILNSIVWSNSAPAAEQIDGSTIVRFSDVEGGYPYPGSNIDADPIFVDAPNGDFHLQAGSPCIDTGDPNSPLDPDSTRADMGAFYYHQQPPCQPTEMPFIDNFDSPELDSCWTWNREDTSHWSLTERPGWMRIVTQIGNVGQDNRNNLLRTRPDTSFQIEAHVEINSTQHAQQAGLLFLLDDDNWLGIVRTMHPSGPMLAFHGEANGVSNEPGVFTSISPSDTSLWFRIQVMGYTAKSFWSRDGVEWIYYGQYWHGWIADRSCQIGLYADNGGIAVTEIPADFDYFRVDSLPGTTVCGDVSGVWDTTGSPYYVTCDVTVPAGQSLEIRPGVEVLFTGHYKFNVYGNLRAIGTQQDSIVFSSAFPILGPLWLGIRCYSAQDTVRLGYCIIEYGSSTAFNGEVPIGSDQFAGGLYAENSKVEVKNCSIRRCISAGGGGGLHFQSLDYGFVSKCMFYDCTSQGLGGVAAAAAVFCSGGRYDIDYCTFWANMCNSGTVVGFEMTSGLPNTVRNCTFQNNYVYSLGYALHLSNAEADVRNCIVWDQYAHLSEPSDPNSVLNVEYSNVWGGYAGNGNIDTDPLFVDAQRDLNLQSSSPCIDTGDPMSPPDPDGTRADMGAYPFYQPPVCGTVSGVWPAYSVKRVACDLLVPEGESLIIEPGVNVEFLGDYKLTVEGTLIAEGTASDSIVFWTDTLANPARWRGVRFISADGSRLEYCKFQYASVTGLAEEGYGGAVYCSNSSPSISHCSFVDNSARNGGGLNLNINSDAVVTHCLFARNIALERGGGLWIWDSEPLVSNCRFDGNSAVTGGGAIRARQNVVLTLDSCEFVNNEGTTNGGALFASVLCSLNVQNTTFSNNHGVEGGAVAVDTSYLQLQDCQFVENTARWGGAVNAKRMLPNSLVERTMFRGNRSIPLGTSGAGGAVAIYSQPLMLQHCLLDSNSARLGGAVEVTLTHGYFTNCTFVNNSATVSGALGYSWQGHHHYTNSIFDNNSAAAVFYLDGGSSTSEVRFADWYQMPSSFANTPAPAGFHNLVATSVNGDSVDVYGNLFADPLFGVNEYDLLWNSPAIDAGDSTSVYDADGSPADQGWKAFYQPTLVVIPDSLDFGTLFYGDDAERFVTILNPSTVPAPLLGTSVTNAAFTPDTLPDWLVPGDSITLSVVFTPPMEGVYNDTLRLTSRLAGADVLDVSMTAIVPLVPGAVDSLVITLGALNGTQLYWAPVTTTTSGQPFTPAYYVIYGAIDPDGPYTPFGVSATTSYHHPFIISSQQKYFYYVTASDGSAVMGAKDVVKTLETGE